MTTTRQGRVTRIYHERGFGFLRDDADHTDRFFHAGAISPLSVTFDELETGDVVRFTPIADDQGRPRAICLFLLARERQPRSLNG